MAEPGETRAQRRLADAARLLESAVAHHRAGRIDRAEALYRKILTKIPDHPDALHMLGAIATYRGRPQRAIQLIGGVLARFPKLADAHVNLGNAYRLAGKRPDAVSCYRRAIALKPDHALAHSSLGREQIADGDFLAAILSCRLAAELDPEMPEAHLQLGIACWRAGALAEAEDAFRQVLRLAPQNVAALAHLALVLVELSRFEEAGECQRTIVALHPQDARAHRALAVCEFRSGEVNPALDRFRHAVELDPRFAEGWTSLGWALRALGRFDEAIGCFRRALAIDPDLAEARRSLAATGQKPADPAEIDRLSAILDAPEAAADARAATGFALGALYDGADDYDRAFACFAKANGLVRQGLVSAGRGYDPRAFDERIDRLIGGFTPEFLAAASAGGTRSELPVFIVGMPRSGTTLVEQIAASHSRVFGVGELTDIARLAAALPGPAADRRVIERWTAAAPTLGAAHLARLTTLGLGAARVIDKLPDNVLNLGAVAALFPEAHVIFCERDSRDICLSSYFQFFAGGNAYSYDLGECAHRCLAVERLVRHWRRVLPLRMIVVGYEALVGNLEAEARRLIEFLGLEWEPGCLEFHRTERVVVTQSTWQVRQPLNSRSIGRWQLYRRHLTPLLEALAAGEKEGRPKSAAP